MIGRLRRGIRAAGLPVRAALVLAVRAYRVGLGGLMGGHCRFYPSCSAYAEQVIREQGAARGLALAVWRILRCSPLTRGGVDRPPRPRPAATYDTVIQPISDEGSA